MFSATSGAVAATSTKLVNSTSAGVEGDGAASTSELSNDGRYVVFAAEAGNLGDGGWVNQIFRKDRVTGELRQVSTDSNGDAANDNSYEPDISDDGRFIAFASDADNLVSGDTNADTDIFVKDLQTGSVVRVSESTAGVEGDAWSATPSISADGQRVAFESSATTLVANDNNVATDVFVRDLAAQTTTRMSTDGSGGQANSDSFWAKIAADGQTIVFTSRATNLVAGDSNQHIDIFAKRSSGATTRVSRSTAGVQGDDDSWDPSISADGKNVAFASAATNLVVGDTNAGPNSLLLQGVDVFVSNLDTGNVKRVSVATNGTQGEFGSFEAEISGNGRYVAFDSYAGDLIEGLHHRTNGIYLADTQTGRIQLASIGDDRKSESGNSPAISGSGRQVTYWTEAAVDGAQDDGSPDIFIRDIGSTDATAAISEPSPTRGFDYVTVGDTVRLYGTGSLGSAPFTGFDDPAKITSFKWTVSGAGKLQGGQGKPELDVAVERLGAVNINLEVVDALGNRATTSRKITALAPLNPPTKKKIAVAINTTAKAAKAAAKTGKLPLKVTVNAAASVKLRISALRKRKQHKLLQVRKPLKFAGAGTKTVVVRLTPKVRKQFAKKATRKRLAVLAIATAKVDKAQVTSILRLR